MEKLLLKAEAAAKILDVSLAHFHGLNNSGKIPSPIRLGKSVRWSIQELIYWVNEGCPERIRWNHIVKEYKGVKQELLNITEKYQEERQKIWRKRIDSEFGTRAERLEDSYVKHLICDGTILRNKDIPKELVALKKAQLKYKRYLKENENVHETKEEYKSSGSKSRRCAG